jgi:hypothetical protein
VHPHLSVSGALHGVVGKRRAQQIPADALEPPVILPHGKSTAIGDFDGDGQMELAVVTVTPGTELGDGRRDLILVADAFGAAKGTTIVSSGRLSFDIGAGDLNRDGVDDIFLSKRDDEGVPFALLLIFDP